MQTCEDNIDNNNVWQCANYGHANDSSAASEVNTVNNDTHDGSNDNTKNICANNKVEK